MLSGSERARADYEAKFQEVLNQAPRRATFNVDSEECTGDYLSSCADVRDSFYCANARKIRYCYNALYNSEECYDVSSFGEGMDRCYELSGCGGALGKNTISNTYFSSYIFYGGYKILYSISCHETSTELFGCTDLRRASYCILNTQYSEREYQALALRLAKHMQETGEWGEFFPTRFSPLPYNESLAHEFFPLIKDEAGKIGARWAGERSKASAPNTLSAAELPDRSSEGEPLK